MESLGCCQRTVGACSCSSSSSRDDTEIQREQKTGKAANYALLCKTYLLLKWRAVEAGKGIWVTLAHWSHMGKVYNIPTPPVKWSRKQQTGTFMDPAQSSAGYSCYTSTGESTGWECAHFSGAGPSHFTCCMAIGILSGVTALFSCSKTSPKGNGPSQPESKPTEHVGPNPVEYFYFYWLFKSTKIMYLMFVSCIILMSGYLVPC